MFRNTRASSTEETSSNTRTDGRGGIHTRQQDDESKWKLKLLTKSLEGERQWTNYETPEFQNVTAVRVERRFIRPTYDHSRTQKDRQRATGERRSRARLTTYNKYKSDGRQEGPVAGSITDMPPRTALDHVNSTSP